MISVTVMVTSCHEIRGQMLQVAT